ncbi:MAG TPA: hypothetical protein DHV14_01785, partial [Micrococcales bacterium]|nr:hypothetical protein [Micrococcales bacterium]
LAGAALAVALLGPVWRLADGMAGRARSVAATLGVRAVARRQRTLGVPLLLLTTAVATAVLASWYTGSARAAQESVAITAAGADARVDLPARSAVSSAFPPRSLAPLRDATDVAQAGGVARVPARIGADDLTLLGLPDVDVARGGSVGADTLLAAIATPAAAGLAPGDVAVTGLVLDDVTSPTPEGRATAWFGASTGDLAREPMTEVDGRVVARVPDGGPWHLLAVDVPAAAVVGESAVRVTQDGGDLAPGWTVTSWPGALLRLTPEPAAAEVPAALSTPLAQRWGAEVGSRVDVRYRGTTLPVTVALVAD